MKYLVVMILPLLAGGCAAAGGRVGAAPVPTTICSLVARPDTFNGVEVRVTALVSSDGIEHTTLVDEGCVRRGVVPLIPDHLRADPGVVAFEQAISSGHIGTRGKEIRATFVGTFRFHRGKVPARALTVTQIINMQVRILDAVPDVGVKPHG